VSFVSHVSPFSRDPSGQGAVAVFGVEGPSAPASAVELGEPPVCGADGLALVPPEHPMALERTIAVKEVKKIGARMPRAHSKGRADLPQASFREVGARCVAEPCKS
jgi:hypothetical protein